VHNVDGETHQILAAKTNGGALRQPKS